MAWLAALGPQIAQGAATAASTVAPAASAALAPAATAGLSSIITSAPTSMVAGNAPSALGAVGGASTTQALNAAGGGLGVSEGATMADTSLRGVGEASVASQGAPKAPLDVIGDLISLPQKARNAIWEGFGNLVGQDNAKLLRMGPSTSISASGESAGRGGLGLFSGGSKASWQKNIENPPMDWGFMFQ